MVNMEHSIIPWSPKIKSHDQIWFIVLSRIPSFSGGLLPVAGDTVSVFKGDWLLCANFCWWLEVNQLLALSSVIEKRTKSCFIKYGNFDDSFKVSSSDGIRVAWNKRYNNYIYFETDFIFLMFLESLSTLVRWKWNRSSEFKYFMMLDFTAHLFFPWVMNKWLVRLGSLALEGKI